MRELNPLPPVGTPSARLAGPLVGREREVATLREALGAALAGRGSLLLLGGDAGIGKTALAEHLAAEAGSRGAFVLVGRCYDLTETPPYGPWREVFDRWATAAPDVPAAPAALLGADSTGPAGQATLLGAVRDLLAAAAAQRPLVVLLDDLHWADPASLELLRYLARQCVALPLLLVGTYRADELSRGHRLFHLLPLLEREAGAARLELGPLDGGALADLVAARYALEGAETARLAGYLRERAAGNPFYTGELLRALEEEGLLRRPMGTSPIWTLGDLAAAGVPALLREVIVGRVARLGEEAHHLLTVAAVIGHEVPLPLWVAVGDTPEERVLAAAERAVAAHLLVEAGDGLRFAHALVREALYDDTLALRRRSWHRRIADALAAGAEAAGQRPDPGLVAYHLRQAGDPRATEWLARAGEWAQCAGAWLTAAERFSAALALTPEDQGTAGERGWLHYRIARLRRFADPRRGIDELLTATGLAAEAGDPLLAAHAAFYLGLLRCQIGILGRGLAEMETGLARLAALPEELRAARRPAETLDDEHDREGLLTLWLAHAGRYAEAGARGEGRLAAGATPAAVADANVLAPTHFGLAYVYAATGQPEAARGAFDRARAAYRAAGYLFAAGMAAVQELTWVALPYLAEWRAERRRLAAEAAGHWARAEGSQFRAPPDYAHLSLHLLEGRWTEARRLALRELDAAGAPYVAVALRALAALARDQGDAPLAARLVREWLPDGLATRPGEVYYPTALVLQRLAAWAALDAGAPDAARDWLAAHDRWLAWGGVVLGRAEGALGWAAYARAVGDLSAARRHAERALALAKSPRQPLALLAAHRLNGELETTAGRHADAAAHLEAALALADACAAPHERALTLLALAELRAVEGETGAARVLLGEAQPLLATLAARPALGRAAALAERLAAGRPSRAPRPGGLTGREFAVLRLIAAGRTNRQIADELFLTTNTVKAYAGQVYGKLQAQSRTEAVARARELGLLP